ncbi:hypothetical protein INR49_000048, partial [Caranx melampygus]
MVLFEVNPSCMETYPGRSLRDRLDQGRFSSAEVWTQHPPPLTGCRCSATEFDTALTLKQGYGWTQSGVGTP